MNLCGWRVMSEGEVDKMESREMRRSKSSEAPGPDGDFGF